jgi:hypothetical protein
MTEEQKISGTLSVSMKVNLGNYESAEAFISINGINEDTTDGEILTLLDGKMKVTYDLLKVRIKERVINLRKDWQEKHS